MNTIRVFTNISDDFPTLQHYDSRVFPDNSAWYSLYKRAVEFEALEPRFYESRNDETAERVLLPLVRSSSRGNVITLASMENYYSVDFRPLCNTAKSRAQLEPLIKYIICSESPDIIRLNVLDSDSPETPILERAVMAEGWPVFRGVSQINWVHDFSGTFQDYLESRPRRLQNTLRRKSARLKLLPNMQITFHDGQLDLEKLLAAYGTIYAKSWKVAEPHQEFVPELIRQTARAGHLRLGLLTVDTVPVAAHFWIVKEGRAFIYKLAHDQNYDCYSPGTVLMAEMIKHVLSHDEVKRLDFLSGDDQYKQDWMSERREKIVFVAYNPRSIRGQALRIHNEYAKPFARNIMGLRSGPDR